MLSQGPHPLDNSISSQVSPHFHDVDLVFTTIKQILAASADIKERGSSSLPSAMLEKVSDVSEYLGEEVVSILSVIPPLHKPLIIYERILVDIQNILSSSDHVEISLADDTINRRLDDFLLQFQETLDLLKSPTDCDQQSSPNSPHFFQNSHHIIISGGNFSVNTSSPVVHDPVLREQSERKADNGIIMEVDFHDYFIVCLPFPDGGSIVPCRSVQ